MSESLLGSPREDVWGKSETGSLVQLEETCFFST